MDIDEALSGRRAARDFTAQAVDDKTSRRLIDAAVRAPSTVDRLLEAGAYAGLRPPAASHPAHPRLRASRRQEAVDRRVRVSVASS
jgi:nitroreductase